MNSHPKHTPHHPQNTAHFELKTAPKNAPYHTRRKTLQKWRTSPEFALEFKLRWGSPQRLSSKSLGNVKKRVDPLTKGGCDEVDYTVAFTPKGGCPLKPSKGLLTWYITERISSIHPQGWVPIETGIPSRESYLERGSSIHPQGWVPIETLLLSDFPAQNGGVAFTPKGGCPLKLERAEHVGDGVCSSIHPQGWVPIETDNFSWLSVPVGTVAFTPKGGCPLKLPPVSHERVLANPGSIHPQGWVPIETRLLAPLGSRTAPCVAFTPKGGC